MPYSTRKHTLRLEPCACIAATARIDGELIRVRYPADMNYADEPVQEAIRRGIEQAWRIEAQQYLPGRVAELCRELGLIDYILIHELCHTLHRNHGPAFHALLDRMTGGKHRLLQKELRDYSTRWGR